MKNDCFYINRQDIIDAIRQFSEELEQEKSEQILDFINYIKEKRKHGEQV